MPLCYLCASCYHDPLRTAGSQLSIFMHMICTLFLLCYFYIISLRRATSNSNKNLASCMCHTFHSKRWSSTAWIPCKAKFDFRLPWKIVTCQFKGSEFCWLKNNLHERFASTLCMWTSNPNRTTGLNLRGLWAPFFGKGESMDNGCWR